MINAVTNTQGLLNKTSSDKWGIPPYVSAKKAPEAPLQKIKQQRQQTGSCYSSWLKLLKSKFNKRLRENSKDVEVMKYQ